MAKNRAEWASGHRQLTRIGLSDGCGGELIPVAVQSGYHRNKFEGHLGNVGSIVPFVGTAIGATVGGVLGALTVGVAVDAALLQLEEALNRENFERDLVNAIQEARREFAQEYLGSPELTVP